MEGPKQFPEPPLKEVPKSPESLRKPPLRRNLNWEACPEKNGRGEIWEKTRGEKKCRPKKGSPKEWG